MARIATAVLHNNVQMTYETWYISDSESVVVPGRQNSHVISRLLRP